MKKSMKVVGAIIENQDHEILCALRSKTMNIAHHWEFPGGKLEEGETVSACIEREIQEELGCKIACLSVFHDTIHEYEKFTVHLITMKCRILEGNPIPKEHSRLLWLSREELTSLVWAPADVPSVEKLASEIVI